MYGILEGTIRLSWTATNGKISHEDIVAGHVFGAGALVMEDTASGTATASKPCRD